MGGNKEHCRFEELTHSTRYLVDGVGAGADGVGVVVLDGGVVVRGAVVVVGGEVADEPGAERSVNVKATKPMSRAATTTVGDVSEGDTQFRYFWVDSALIL